MIDKMGRCHTDRDKTVYLVIRGFLCNTGLDVTHERVNEATALSHCLPLLLFATGQVPACNTIVYSEPSGHTCLKCKNRHKALTVSI